MERGPALAKLARARIEQELGGPIAIPPDEAWAKEPGATFVTLRWPTGELQGCIGNLSHERAIAADVASNAVAAATRDPRGKLLSRGDVAKLEVEVSILSALEPIGGVEDIRVGTDGILLEARGRRATFLPIMWAQLPDRDTFMRELLRKAGLREVAPGELKLQRYTADVFVDHGVA